MTNAQPVRFYDGQSLCAADLNEEQRFRLSIQRRHTLAFHGWGVVDGLALRVVEGSAFIDPGYAVDGFGRDVVLVERRHLKVSSADLGARGLVGFGVWIGYDRQPFGEDRWSQAPQVWTTPTPPGGDRRKPPAAAPPPDSPWTLSQDPPDDPCDVWPVYLGFLGLDALSDGELTVDLANRPLITARAQAIVSCDGLVELEIGSDRAGSPAGLNLQVRSDPEAEPCSAFRLSRAGDLSVAGELSAGGGLHLAGPLQFEASPAEPSSPGWRIYRSDTAEGPELRIELGSTDSTLEIGAATPGTPFQPAFTVTGAGAVKIAGDLIVGGRLHPAAPLAGEQTLSPEAEASIRATTLALTTQRALLAAVPVAHAPIRPSPQPAPSDDHAPGTEPLEPDAPEPLPPAAPAATTPAHRPPPASNILGKLLAAPLKPFAALLSTAVARLDPPRRDPPIAT